MSKVYHYTSLETLALILKTRRIRFSRIDQMDDQTETDGLPGILKKKYFLSCWVKEKNEIIPQWAMYAQRGVRIEFPKKWYVKHDIPVAGTDLSVKELPIDSLNNKPFFIIPFEEWRDLIQKNGIMVTTPMNEDNGLVVEVEYSSNFLNLKSKSWIEDEHSGGVKINDPFPLVRYKDEKWSFQNEMRYYIIITKSDKSESGVPQYIDVPVSEDVLNQINITVYPNCSDADYLITEALLEKYTDRETVVNRVHKSELDGKYYNKKIR